MSIKKSIALASFFGIALVATGLAADVSFVLTAEPARTLPGIPVSLQVVAINDSGADVALPKGLLLRVVPETGEPFLAQWGFGQERRYSSAAFPEHPATLRGHSRSTFVFAAADIERAAGWFVDPRLNVPGTYRLELLITDAFSEEEIIHTPALQLESVVPVKLTSTQTVLTVDVPEGEDRALWERLKEFAAKRGVAVWSIMYWDLKERAAFAQDAVENHPHSRYAAYAVPYSISIPDAQRIDAARRILEAQPSTPNREHLQLFVAQTEAAVAGDAEAAEPPNEKLAIEMTERARMTFAMLERGAVDAGVRHASRAAREKLPTVQELQQRMRR